MKNQAEKFKATHKAKRLLSGGYIEGVYTVINENGKEYHTIFDGEKHIIINLMTLQDIEDTMPLF